VATLAADPGKLRLLGEAAENTSRQYFSESVVCHQLRAVLQDLPA
jgi:hypothetical protein